VLLVEAGRLERERGDEDSARAALAGLGLERVQKCGAEAAASALGVYPGQADPGGLAPRPAAHACSELAVGIAYLDGQLLSGRDTRGTFSVDDVELGRQSLVEFGALGTDRDREIAAG
jgi:hypothetical protein